MLTHIAHLIALLKFPSAHLPSLFKVKHVASPASVVFTHVIVQEKKSFIMIAPFLLPSPFFMLFHPPQVVSNRLLSELYASYVSSPMSIVFPPFLFKKENLCHYCPLSAFISLIIYCLTPIG